MLLRTRTRLPSILLRKQCNQFLSTNGNKNVTSCTPYYATHEVFNQSQPFENINLFQSDPILRDLFKNNKDKQLLHDFGGKSGTTSIMEAAELAEKNIPKLRNFDIYGRRIDVIDYHPAYHTLMDHALSNGCAAHGFRVGTEGSQLTRAALIYMEGQLEAGHVCPVVMTAASLPLLKNNASRVSLAKEYYEKILLQRYDGRNIPTQEKAGVTIGMSMTEKQGGSDVRANTTMATPIVIGKTGIGAEYTLRGHKWFTSAPMCDAFLTLAKTHPDTAPSCFLVPRWCPDRSRNFGLQIMRLKDKCADRANASSEIEYRDAWGVMVGEEGKGVKTIIEMVQATRLDCTLGSAATGRRAFSYIVNHTHTRKAFGKLLSEQPLMQQVLADLAIEAEAHTTLAFQMAKGYDLYYNHKQATEEEKEFFRVALSISKYYVTKRLPNFTYECLEALGGNGFVEDFPLARLFRHSPLNSVWEGSGNVIALDLLRAFQSLPLVVKELRKSSGLHKGFDNNLHRIETALKQFSSDPLGMASQRQARWLCDRLAVALQAHYLLKGGNEEVTKAFLQSRLMEDGGDSRGFNFGGSVVFEEKVAKYLIERNIPVFEK